MRHIKVIGAGLFGSIITRALREEGHLVTLIDGFEGFSGSDPAACLMKPSWFSSMGPDVFGPSLSLLDRLYGIEEIDFRVGPIMTKVKWINPAKILAERATAVQRFASIEEVTDHVEGVDLTVVAAGIWANEILPAHAKIPDLSPRQGVAFLYPNARIDEPFIRPWAPYRQLVAFNRGDGLWVSDGTAVKELTDSHYIKARQRCWDAIKGELGDLSEALKGATWLKGNRPYVAGAKPCYLKRHDNLIVANGGAKNGTIAAGWCASQIVEMAR